MKIISKLVLFLIIISSTKAQDILINNFYIELMKSRQNKQNNKKLKTVTRSLIGFNDTEEILLTPIAEKFSMYIDETISKLQKKQKTKDCNKLKNKRNIEDLKESKLFILTVAKIFDLIQYFPDIIDTLIQRCPWEIPDFSFEILAVLKSIVTFCNKEQKKIGINDMLAPIKNLAFSDEDGTYVLSGIVSSAINNENSDIEKIINEKDFSDQSVRRYLNITQINIEAQN